MKNKNVTKKGFSGQLNPEDHRQFRIVCAKNDLNTSELVSACAHFQEVIGEPCCFSAEVKEELDSLWSRSVFHAKKAGQGMEV